MTSLHNARIACWLFLVLGLLLGQLTHISVQIGGDGQKTQVRAIQTPTTMPPFIPNSGPKYRLPNAPSVSAPPKAGGAYWVHGVRLRDTGQNVTHLLNYYGHKNGIEPYNLAAVMATESGWRAVADRYGCGPIINGCADVSHGPMQFTDQTAIGFGVCHDDASCKAWLDVPKNSIRMAAIYLAQIERLSCERFVWTYVAYNAGPYMGCGAYFYTHPTGSAYYALYDNFIPNQAAVLAHYLWHGK